MSDLIDRCNLRLMRTEECAGHTIEYALGWKACIEWMKTLPSAQPEQKVGKWLLYGRGTAKCSQCGMVYIDAYDDDRCFNYCPNCGAKMEECDG